MIKKIILLFSYLIIFYISLWLALSVRHFDLRGWEFYKEHLFAFSFLFLIWIFVLYSTRLFDLHIVSNRKKLINFTIKATILNFLTGTAFFYLFAELFEKINITPKTNLLLTAVISSAFIYILLYAWSKINKYNNPSYEQLININVKEKTIYEIEKSIKKSKKTTPYYLSKIIIDKLVAFCAFFILIIIFLPIAIAIKLNDNGPIFFKQKRVGKNDNVFLLWKFRTMKSDTPQTMWTDKKDNRITVVGKFLRKTHLDELPQCINILRNEMSIVGPRADYVKLVRAMKEKNSLYYLRHLVKPGITGWAQLHYIYGDSIETNLKKLEYDLWYVKNRSIFLDLVITIKTISVVLDHTGR